MPMVFLSLFRCSQYIVKFYSSLYILGEYLLYSAVRTDIHSAIHSIHALTHTHTLTKDAHVQPHTIVSLILSLSTMFFTLHWANCVENLATPHHTTKICWFISFFLFVCDWCDAPIYSMFDTFEMHIDRDFRLQTDKTHSRETILDVN